jgi:hypothetical protein
MDTSRTRKAQIAQRDHVAVAPRKANDLGLDFFCGVDGSGFKS